jgi:4-azaleucine resistance transporter AzlC
MTPWPGASTRGALLGAQGVLVRVGGIVVYGIAFGVAASAAGLSFAEATLMSALVNAGAAQFAALQVWGDPVPLAAAAFAALTMNARFILLGAALRPMFAGASPAFAYGALFFLYDGNWALALEHERRQQPAAAVFFGAGLFIYCAWVGSTAMGHAFGQLIADPKRYGLDFTVVAFFATMAAGFWRGRGDIVPVLAAIIGAVAADRFLGGSWHIVVGAIAGCLAAAIAHRPVERAA